MNSIHRRDFLKGTVAGAVVAVAAGAGLLKPGRVLAAEWPKGAFDAHSIEDVLKAMYKTGEAAASASVTVKGPTLAEDATGVEITVASTLPNVDMISVLVAKNPRPLVMNLATAGAEPYAKIKIKMGETSDVIGVVRSGGKLYSGKALVKVTAGGCGG